MIYVSKYPVEQGYPDKDGKCDKLPSGTAFTVIAIGQVGLRLKTLNKVSGVDEFEFSPESIKLGFNEVKQLQS